MIFVVGLGNFGKTYENTYHNLGFMVVDKLAERMGVSFSKEKYKAKKAECLYQGEKVVLVKPLTYMNNSGESVVLIKKQFKDVRILVCVDDIDLPTGTIRYREKGSSGTHNGLRSIVGYIGENFERVKIGIDRDKNMDLADFVLSKIRDINQYKKIIEEACDVVCQKIVNKQ